MIKRIFAAVLLMSLFISQFILPSQFASAEAGISIESEVRAAPEEVYLEFGKNAESTVQIDVTPKGEAPKTERPPVDVVLVFDKSGSMNDLVNGKSKMMHAKEAMTAALATFNENNRNRMVKDRFALVAFDSGVSDANSQFVLNSNTSGITDKVTAMKAEGGTNYTNSLEKARLILEGGKDLPNRKQHIIFMTDGKPTNSEKVDNTNGVFKELFEENDYRSRFGNFSYWGKSLYGLTLGFMGKNYVIGDSSNRTYNIIGQKKQYLDTNPGRNYVIVEHNSKYYIEQKTSEAVQTNIKDHIDEQAELISEKGIILNSIGFGEAQNGAQIDMKLLEDISIKGQAINAVGNDIVSILKFTSENITSSKRSLSNGYVQFSLPEGAKLVMEKDSKITQSTSTNGLYKLPLKDILYEPLPNPSKISHYLTLSFTKSGRYVFNFQVVYNGGEYTLNKQATINVLEISVNNVAFNPIEINVGETINLKEYLKFDPLNATNQYIESMTKGPTNAFILTVENGVFKAKGLNPGFDSVKAVVKDGQKQINAAGTIVVKDPNDSSELKW
ncbi:VWA domain-containing protein [Metabacillus sp. KIGAM252]|uniref:VWA domain-containing protein n=1 Tax=Metabacillus flavus TaxID=2823519 RepID=A0ABS5LGM4_9BACI|nr:vWA domain-containing protein [Metabacillus flavus]MBS2969898.1 VWA domain-containing protein [Metabacillus flavus]